MSNSDAEFTGDRDAGSTHPRAGSAGTKIAATNGAVNSASRYHDLREAHMRVIIARWVQIRPRKMMIGFIFVAAVLCVAHYPTHRLLLLIAINACSLLYHAFEAVRARRCGFDERSLFLSHIVSMTLHGLMIGITGGIRSPLLPPLLGHSLGTVSIAGRSRVSTITVVYGGAIVVVLALLPAWLAGPTVPALYYAVLMTWGMLFSMAMSLGSSFAINDAYRAVGESLDRAREEVVAASGERTRSLEQIGARVAHELKNPLAAIKGLAQLLSRNEQNPRAQERFRVITDEVTRMETILRDYLSFSRPLEEIRARPVELSALVDDVISILEARAENARVSLSRSGGRANVVGDARRLKEAVLNLVANALESTPSGGAIDVGVHRTERGAQLVVKDSGKGMSEEVLAKIGTPFYTTREGGTGLGVVLARSVVTQHGGNLAYASKPGGGTTVTLTLPARPCGDASLPLPCERAMAAALAAETAPVASKPRPTSAPSDHPEVLGEPSVGTAE